jgi:hypothetical protein
VEAATEAQAEAEAAHLASVVQAALA